MSENDNESMKPLRELGNNYFKHNLFKEEEKVMKYDKQIAIGKKRDGKVYYLDTREAFRAIAIGMTRSGKTWILRAIADRAAQLGDAVIFIPDVKDEFKSSVNPVQEKFRKFLDKIT